MLLVEFQDPVQKALLVGNVLVVEELLSALGFIKVPHLSWAKTEEEELRGERDLQGAKGSFERRFYVLNDLNRMIFSLIE